MVSLETLSHHDQKMIWFIGKIKIHDIVFAIITKSSLSRFLSII